MKYGIGIKNSKNWKNLKATIQKLKKKYKMKAWQKWKLCSEHKKELKRILMGRWNIRKYFEEGKRKHLIAKTKQAPQNAKEFLINKKL